MNENSNFAVISHKQDLLVIIPIYNEKKMKLSQLRCTSVLIRTDLWHIIDQNEKNNKTPYYMVYKTEEFWQNGQKL